MRSFLNNITIGRRLLLGFAVVLLCSLLAIGIGIARLHTVAEYQPVPPRDRELEAAGIFS